MDFTLHPVEVRVLGALIEKEITTPEYYPLSANALVNACNQKSNRDPVVAFDEETVLDAVDALRAKSLTTEISGAGSRVRKYGHRLSDALNLGRREIALLCELMLRGPQTVGELRNRAERMHRFDDASEVESVLERMPTLVTPLPKRPGEKERRYAHLLSGPVSIEDAREELSSPRPSGARGELESEVAQLRSELTELRREFEQFKRNFE